MATRPLILLPPSEGKSDGGAQRPPKDRFADELGGYRQVVREALRSELVHRSSADLSKLLRVRGPLLVRALESTRLLVDEQAPMMPAWRRYSGVVWGHLDPASLSASSRSRLLIPSALYGLNVANDAIADYRLTMHASLGHTGNLATYWRQPITEVLNAFRGRPPIVNLLPAEHARAVDMSLLSGVVDVRFIAFDGTGAAGHQAKAVKGRFARHLIDYGIGKATDFRFDDWTISKNSAGFVLRAPR